MYYVLTIPLCCKWPLKSEHKDALRQVPYFVVIGNGILVTHALSFARTYCSWNIHALIIICARARARARGSADTSGSSADFGIEEISHNGRRDGDSAQAQRFECLCVDFDLCQGVI